MRIEPGGFLSRANVSFNRRKETSKEKVTEHEVPGVTLRNIRMVNPPALDFSGWRSIHLVKNCRREIFSEYELHGLKQITRIKTKRSSTKSVIRNTKIKSRLKKQTLKFRVFISNYTITTIRSTRLYILANLIICFVPGEIPFQNAIT